MYCNVCVKIQIILYRYSDTVIFIYILYTLVWPYTTSIGQLTYFPKGGIQDRICIEADDADGISDTQNNDSRLSSSSWGGMRYTLAFNYIKYILVLSVFA